MSYAVGDLVQARVAIDLQGSGTPTYTNDRSIGEIWDPSTSTWGDIVWVDTQVFGSYCHGIFGNALYVCRITLLSSTKDSITRMRVVLHGYVSGGVEPDGFIYTNVDSFVFNRAQVTLAGVPIVTQFENHADVTNQVSVRGIESRVGWKGRIGPGAVWHGNQNTQSNFRLIKSFNTTEDTTLPANLRRYVSYMSSDELSISALNTWLGTNKPEYGSCILFDISLVSERDVAFYQGTRNERHMHSYVATFAAGPEIHFRRRVFSQRYNNVTASASAICDSDTEVSNMEVISHATDASGVATLNWYGYLGGSTNWNAGTLPSSAGGTLAITLSVRLIAGYTRTLEFEITIDSDGYLTGISLVAPNADTTIIHATGRVLYDGGRHDITA